MSLRHAIASGVKWSSVSQGGRQGLQLVTTAVLAHLLQPSDFGLVGMSMVVVGFVILLRDLGTSEAVIQRKEIPDEFLSSIFWLNAVLGLFAMIVLYLSSPLVGSLYRETRIEPLMKTLSFTFAVSGFSVLQQAVLERALQFDKLAKIELAAALSGSLTGIFAALNGCGAMSLAYQTLAVTAVTTVLLWIACPWRPEIVFRLSEARSISRYSLNLTGYNVFNYLSRNADNFLIGRFLGAQNLGYYTLAYTIMYYPIQNISGVIGRVLFPAYSQMQEDNARFRHAYLKVASAISLISFPIMMGLMVVCKPLLLSVFGPQWSPAVILLLILSPVGLIQSVGTTVGAIYQAKGRTDWMLRWGVVTGILVVTAFLIGLGWGIVGVASAYAIVSLLIAYPNFAVPFHLINLRMRDLGAVLWRPLLCGLIMAVPLQAIKLSMPGFLSNAAVLGILIPVGGMIYLLVSWLLNRTQMVDCLRLLNINSRERQKGALL